MYIIGWDRYKFDSQSVGEQTFRGVLISLSPLRHDGRSLNSCVPRTWVNPKELRESKVKAGRLITSILLSNLSYACMNFCSCSRNRCKSIIIIKTTCRFIYFDEIYSICILRTFQPYYIIPLFSNLKRNRQFSNGADNVFINSGNR